MTRRPAKTFEFHYNIERESGTVVRDVVAAGHFDSGNEKLILEFVDRYTRKAKTYRYGMRMISKKTGSEYYSCLVSPIPTERDFNDFVDAGVNNWGKYVKETSDQYYYRDITMKESIDWENDLVYVHWQTNGAPRNYKITNWFKKANDDIKNKREITLMPILAAQEVNLGA